MPRKITSYHSIVVPSPFENYADDYQEFAEKVDTNLPKMESAAGSRPAANADNQDNLYIEANTTGTPASMYVSDGVDWVEQSLDVPELEATDITLSNGLANATGDTVLDTTANTLTNVSIDTTNASVDNVAVNTELTDGSGTRIFDSSTTTLENVTLDSSTTVPKAALDFTPLTDADVVNASGDTMTGSLKFDAGGDGSEQVEIVDVTTNADSQGDTTAPNDVTRPSLEVRQPGGADADLRVTGTLKEV